MSSKCERSSVPRLLVVNGSETGITSAVACCKNGGGRELTVDNGGRRRGDRRCGLCSLVARAFRRAVCGAPSRRGSGDSYQELTAPPPTTEEETAQVSFLFNALLTSLFPFCCCFSNYFRFWNCDLRCLLKIY